MSSFVYIEEIEKSGRFDHIQEVRKFNPYHGKDGRFSTADASASFTYKPGQGVMYDRAIAREKERTAGNSNDPAMIAGVKRGTPMTHEQADAGNCNPQYGKADELRARLREADEKLYNARKSGASEEELNALQEEQRQRYREWDQAYDESAQYRDNCQSCVVAYEARRRGYDVEATGRTKKNKIQEDLARDQSIAFIDPATGKAPKTIKNDPSVRTYKQATKWLDENTESGGRYQFSHGWKGTDGMCGHIVTVQKDISGAMSIFDPQNGKTYSGDGFYDYMKNVRPTASVKHYSYTNRSGVQSTAVGRLGLLRVDNLELNESVLNAVLKGAE